jgi:hypothetical protein
MDRRFILVPILLCLLIPGIALADMTIAPNTDAPTNLTASLTGGTVHLSWNPPMNNGGSPITSYVVYRGDSPGSGSFIAETPSTNYADNNITTGNTYYYSVSAKNSIGESPRSNEVSTGSNSNTFSGRIKEADSNDGIGGAHLYFEKQDYPQQNFDSGTDQSGSYSIMLPQGNYRIRIEADGYRSREENFQVDGPMTKDFELDSEEDKGGDFNLSKELGIDMDEIEKVITTAAVIAGVYLCSIPLMLFIAVVLLFMILVRIGKVRKELRARNEKDGIFLSKGREKKVESKKEPKKVEPKKEPKKVEPKKEPKKKKE